MSRSVVPFKLKSLSSREVMDLAEKRASNFSIHFASAMYTSAFLVALKLRTQLVRTSGSRVVIAMGLKLTVLSPSIWVCQCKRSLAMGENYTPGQVKMA